MSLLDERYMQCVKIHLLSYAFAYAVIILCSSQCYSLKSDNFQCKLVGTCVCQFENEEGYNLSALSEDKFGLNVSIGNLIFHFHPCTDISIGNNSALNDCYKGASVCLYNRTDDSYTNLGLSHEVEVISHSLADPVLFVYTHNNSVTRIKTKCTDTNSLEVSSVNSTNKYELLLNSPSACRQPVYVRGNDEPVDTHHHLSTGSVLVIMFIVFASLYFVGGALVLKLLRGAEGREMIPNYDFWVSLPGLVKDGFIFTLSGCRTSQAYDRI